MKDCTPICPYCNKTAILVDSKVVYAKSYGPIWMCSGECEAWVGVHKNSPNFQPLGRLANAHLRRAKQAAHAAFDPLWKDGHMTRTAAYAWLRQALNKNRPVHIGFMDETGCREVIAVSVAKLASLTKTS